jgi:hypothetical protein
MMQIARNLTTAGDGFLRGTQRIILDRDPLYTAAFRRLLRDGGVTPVVLLAWSPNLNAFAERFVESAKSECLDKTVLLGEGHLRKAVREFVHHYHEERPHQGLDNELIAPTTTVIGTGPMNCRERLGGLLKFYYREAAEPSWIEFLHSTTSEVQLRGIFSSWQTPRAAKMWARVNGDTILANDR